MLPPDRRRPRRPGHARRRRARCAPYATFGTPALAAHAVAALEAEGARKEEAIDDADELWLDAQDWWATTPGRVGRDGDPGDDFGHLHTGLCFPIKAELRGVVPLRVRSVLHDNPGRFRQLQVQLYQGDSANVVAADQRAISAADGGAGAAQGQGPRVEPLAPAWPSCIAIFALLWPCTKSTMRFQASRCALGNAAMASSNTSWALSSSKNFSTGPLLEALKNSGE